MNKPLSFGLGLKKKGPPSKPGPPKRRPVFGVEPDEASDDDDRPEHTDPQAQEITELDDDEFTTSLAADSARARGGKSPSSRPKLLSHQQPKPPSIRTKNKLDDGEQQQLGDLASSLTARKHAQSAEQDDPSIYDYDAAYDSFKAPARNAASDAAAAERRPQYMANLKRMAEVRERDRKIAEDKKMKRDREAEGDEFADKEMFVTEAYRKQQEENRLLEEAERRREEEEARRNESGGMTGFYKQILERDDQRRAEMTRAAEELKERGERDDGGARDQNAQPPQAVDEDGEGPKTEADLAREINKKGGSVAINEDGQVVDKRELLSGGLNVGAARKKADEAQRARREAERRNRRDDDGRDGRSSGGNFGGGGRQAMRDRQSRMLEAQYEQTLKRSRDEQAEELKKVEVAAKTRKTESEISSAKERYLARKRAEAEAKKNGEASL